LTTTSPSSPGKPWWKKKWGIVLIAFGALVALGAVGSAIGPPKGSSPSPTPTQAAAEPSGATSPSVAASAPAESPLTATETPASPPAKPIALKGTGSRKTKPFTMRTPARVDLAFTGSGNFISRIVPVGGEIIDGASLSNTIGRTKLRTYVYDSDLEGVRSYADVLSDGAWTITITPGAPTPLPAPASFNGKWGESTRLVHLSGDYTVAFSHAGRGNFIVQLTPADGSFGEPIANQIGRVKGSTQAYGLDGDYYFDVTADGSWTIAIKAQ
jgi:hypothetical protein